MRAVVGSEDHHGVFVKSFLFQQIKDFAHLLVKSGDHAGKLCVGNVGRIVARTLVTSEFTLLAFAELVAVSLENGVVGLQQFSMGQGVGEYSQERFVGALTVNPFQRFLMDQVG